MKLHMKIVNTIQKVPGGLMVCSTAPWRNCQYIVSQSLYDR